MTEVSERPTCTATTLEGVRCKQSTSLSPEGLCIWHDSTRREEAQAARVKGGEGKRKTEIRTVSTDQLPGERPQSLDDVCLWASWSAWAVASGQIDARTSREVNYSLQTLRFGLEKRDLARKVDQLQADIDGLKGKAPKR